MTFFFFLRTKSQSFRIQLLKKKIANISQIKRAGISKMKFETAQIHFLGDVFAAVAVLVA